MNSLRVRLIILLGVAVMLTAAVQLTATFRIAMTQANRLFDYHMQQIALALQDSSLEREDWYSGPNASNVSFDFVLQIWSADGERVYQSKSYRALPPQGQSGFADVTIENGEWRTYTLRTEGRVTQIAQKTETRRNRAFRLILHSIWPVLPASILLLGAVWWVVTSALRPVQEIGNELSSRNAGSLVPIASTGVPSEISILVEELNHLLARISGALQMQQRFVADAAHELRSPITALKLQAQSLAKAGDDSSRQQHLARLMGGIDRSSRLVEQLLQLARHDPLSRTIQPMVVSLNEALNGALEDIAPVASEKNIEIVQNCCVPVAIVGDPDAVRIMIRNLLDNAVRYTPNDGQVLIDLTDSRSSVTLVIQDSGSGIPSHNRERVFDRFYRLPGTASGGTGLGLAIVKAIADQHEAHLQLSSSELGGLSVKITFPSAVIPA
jgi:two-component system OmpR family sensor kinase